ncbi:MAG: FG-GAP-like repeat-containing protein [Gelidibacter sp.]
MIKKLLFATIIGLPVLASSQIAFTNSNSKLANSSLKSGCAIGVADMNGDGLDDIVRLSGATNLQIEYQTSGNFTLLNYGSIPGNGTEWGFAIADVDRNGFNDIIVGGAYNGLKLLKANATGTTYTSTTLGGTSIFLQNANFADIDNNGTIDFFGCSDESVSSAYSNDGAGNFTLNNAGLINAVSTIPSDNSGNYGSIWTDYDNDGDQDLYISKCRLGVSNDHDGRRVNLLFQNDGTNHFTEVGVAAGLVPYAQSWSASFEDIDNDGDLDCALVNHDQSSYIYENNGNGTFTNITSTSGIATELSSMGSDGIQVIMEDFDNDTFIDLFITSRGGSHKLFRNNGNKTFTRITTPFPTTNRIQSAAAGDLNNDGFVDIIAGFGSGYNSPSNSISDVLYLNNGNANHWSEITLLGNPSNINGIGARIEIYGAWGKQIREVRSGESYGIMNSMMTHFGLGSNTSITKIVVNWPSGNVDTLLSPNVDESIVIVEGSTLNINESISSIFKIHPNPTKNIITIDGPQSGDISYEIYDITGKLITSKTTLSTTNHQIELGNLNAGVYFLNLYSNNKRYVHKVIKE